VSGGSFTVERVPILQKPVVQDELAGALSQVLGEVSGAQPAVSVS